MQPAERNLDSWAQWRWAPWALGVWLLAIAGVAAAFGTINSAPHHEIPAATWAAEAALSGLVFGVLLGAFMPEPPWRGEARVLAPAGSAVYALSYEIAVVVGYGGGDSGGAGLVFVVIMITCVAPMMITSGVAYRLRDLTRALKRRLGCFRCGLSHGRHPADLRPKLGRALGRRVSARTVSGWVLP